MSILLHCSNEVQKNEPHLDYMIKIVTCVKLTLIKDSAASTSVL